MNYEAMTDKSQLEYNIRKTLDQISELTKRILELKTEKKFLIMKYEAQTMQLAKIKGEIP